MKMRWYSYDVWGNKKDGYEVNQTFSTNDYVYIPKTVLDGSDKRMTTYLKRIGFFNNRVVNKYVEYDGDDEIIYFSYKDRPEGELRREG